MPSVDASRSDAMLRAVCDIASEGIFFHERGTIVMVNDAIYKMFGYPPGSLRGRSALDFVDADYVDFVRANYESNLPLTYLAWGIRADGARFRVEVQSHNVSFGDGDLRAAIVRDLSSVDDAARERAETISQLRATLDATTDGIIVVDTTGKMRLYNKRFLDLWRMPTTVLDGDLHKLGMQHAAAQLVDPETFFARMTALESAPETESVDMLELRDGRIIERYSRPQRIGERVVGRVWSFRDVTLQRRAEKALEMSVQMRDEFLGIASHELFTPITSLAIAVHGLRGSAGTAPPDVSARLFDNAARQIDRLARLVQELLDVTRIDGGRMGLDIQEAELGEIAKDVLEHFATELERDHIEVALTVPERVVGNWDRSRLEQVVTNLIANAIKFGRRRPIQVNVSLQDGRGELTVSDQGIGVPIDQQAVIFERFQRAVSSQHFAGLGLGLYITRQIVQAHGGTIQLTSVPDEGSTFTVRLPLWPPSEVRR